MPEQSAEPILVKLMDAQHETTKEGTVADERSVGLGDDKRINRGHHTCRCPGRGPLAYARGACSDGCDPDGNMEARDQRVAERRNETPSN